LLNLADRSTRTLAKLIGGAGSLDAPCWSPDSRQVAFVSYQLIPALPPVPR
jgi:Tol biopolymer transport system component